MWPFLNVLYYIMSVASLRLVSAGIVTDGVTFYLKSDDLVWSSSYRLPSPCAPSPSFQVIGCPAFL